MSENKYVNALFGDYRDAYSILKPAKPASEGISTTSLDANDLALVVTEDGGLQLFLPANEQICDLGLAVIEIYNAFCRDRAGMIDGEGRAIAENQPYQGFTEPLIQIMKTRVREPETND